MTPSDLAAVSWAAAQAKWGKNAFPDGTAPTPATAPSPLHRLARAVLTVAEAARTVGVEVPDLTWTADGDLAGRPVLTITAPSPDAGQRLAGMLGLTETPAPCDDTRLWEGTIRGIGTAITSSQR